LGGATKGGVINIHESHKEMARGFLGLFPYHKISPQVSARMRLSYKPSVLFGRNAQRQAFIKELLIIEDGV